MNQTAENSRHEYSVKVQQSLMTLTAEMESRVISSATSVACKLNLANLHFLNSTEHKAEAGGNAMLLRCLVITREIKMSAHEKSESVLKDKMGGKGGVGCGGLPMNSIFNTLSIRC